MFLKFNKVDTVIYILFNCQQGVIVSSCGLFIVDSLDNSLFLISVTPVLDLFCMLDIRSEVVGLVKLGTREDSLLVIDNDLAIRCMCLQIVPCNNESGHVHVYHCRGWQLPPPPQY